MSFFFELFGLNNKFTLYNMVTRNLKIRYRKSVLGMFWTILIPISTAVVYYFVFQKIVRIQVPNYLLFILSGVLPWGFFNHAVMAGLESIVGNHGILNKVPIAPLTFPLTEVVTSFINFLFSVPVLLGVAFLTGAPISLYWLILIPIFLFLFIQAYSLALFCSIIFVDLRDLRHIMALVMQLWFYLTPIIYNTDLIPKEVSWITYANPISLIFQSIHKVLVFGEAISFQSVAWMAAWTLVFFSLSTIVYRKQKKFLVERL